MNETRERTSLRRIAQPTPKKKKREVFLVTHPPKHPLQHRLRDTLADAIYLHELRGKNDLYTLEVTLSGQTQFVAATKQELAGLATLLNDIIVCEANRFVCARHVLKEDHDDHDTFVALGYCPEEADTATYAYATLDEDVFGEQLDLASTPYTFETIFESRTQALRFACDFIENKVFFAVYLHYEDGVRVSWNADSDAPLIERLTHEGGRYVLVTTKDRLHLTGGFDQ